MFILRKRSKILRKIWDTEDEVDPFYDDMPAMEESSIEEEDVCCNWRE